MSILRALMDCDEILFRKTAVFVPPVFPLSPVSTVFARLATGQERGRRSAPSLRSICERGVAE